MKLSLLQTRALGYPVTAVVGYVFFYFVFKLGYLDQMYLVIQLIIAVLVAGVATELLLPDHDGRPVPRVPPKELKNSRIWQFIWFVASILLGGMIGTIAVRLFTTDKNMTTFSYTYIALAIFLFMFLWGLFDLKYLWKREKKQQ